jgi:hypothetical protein
VSCSLLVNVDVGCSLGRPARAFWPESEVMIGNERGV